MSNLNVETGLHHWYWITEEVTGHWFELDVIEQYTTGNSSVIYWKLGRYQTNPRPSIGNQVRVAPTTLNINGVNVYKKTTVSNVDEGTFPSYAGPDGTYKDGTMVIEHDANGNKEIFVGLSTDIYNTTPKIQVNTYVTLTHIPPEPPASTFFSLESNVEDGHKFRFSGTERVDELGNYSVISWTLEHIVTSSSFVYTTVSPITAKIGDTVVYGTETYTQPSAQKFPAGAGSVSGGLVVPHEKNGTKTVEFMLWVSFSSAQAPQDKKTVTMNLTPIQTDTSMVSATIDTPVISGHKLSLMISEASDLQRNGSMISWSLYSTFGDNDYQYTNYNQVYVTINGTQVYSWTLTSGTAPKRVFPCVAGVRSDSIFIQHDDAGDANLSVVLGVDTGGGVVEYTYDDILQNTNIDPPTTTTTLERVTQTEASFIISADTDISAKAYALVEAIVFNSRAIIHLNDYVVHEGNLYKCLDGSIWTGGQAHAWNDQYFELVQMQDISGWLTEGLTYADMGGHEIRTVVSKNLTGNKSYAIIFSIAKMSTGIEGITDIVTFTTTKETILVGADDVKLDNVWALLTFTATVFVSSYTYSIDIYAKATGQPEALLGTVSNITFDTTGMNIWKMVSLPSAAQQGAFLYLSKTTELPMYLLLHTYNALGTEIGSPQRADFKGYLTEADSKPNYATVPEFTHVELNAKVTALLNKIPEFSETESYSQNDKVIKGDKIYKANTNVSAGTWDSSEWDEQDPDNASTFIRNASTCRMELSTRATPRSSNPAIPVTVHYEASVGETVQEGELVEETTIVRSDFKSFSKTGKQPISFDAVDSRGYRNKKSSEVSILDYSKPKINTLTAYRNNNKLGELLIIDGEGTQFAIRDNYVDWDVDDDKGTIVNSYIVSLTNIPYANTGDVPGASTLYDHAHSGRPEDEIKQEIKEVCEYYSETDVTYVTEVLLDHPSITTAYKMLSHYWATTTDWDQTYYDAKVHGVDSTEVLADLYNMNITTAGNIADVKKILRGTYNVNYIVKAELRLAKDTDNYTNNWIDVTSHITQTDTTFTFTCHEDPLIEVDQDFFYKMQLRVYDRLTPDSSPVKFEINDIPPGSPLMAFQKKRVGVNNRTPQAALDVWDFDETVEGATHHVEGYAIHGYPIYDHVIFDQTDNNNVHVRLWSSGRMEVECTKTVTLQNALVRNNPKDITTFANISYPAEFIDPPQLYFSVLDKNTSKPGQVIGMKGTSAYATKKMGEVYLLYLGGDSRSANEQFYVTVRAIGQVPQSSIDSIIGRV